MIYADVKYFNRIISCTSYSTFMSPNLMLLFAIMNKILKNRFVLLHAFFQAREVGSLILKYILYLTPILFVIVIHGFSLCHKWLKNPNNITEMPFLVTLKWKVYFLHLLISKLTLIWPITYFTSLHFIWWIQPIFFRAVHHWMTKNSDNMLKGLKLNLQSIMGSKLPNGLLNFVFKHTYVRKVKRRKKHFDWL